MQKLMELVSGAPTEAPAPPPDSFNPDKPWESTPPWLQGQDLLQRPAPAPSPTPMPPSGPDAAFDLAAKLERQKRGVRTLTEPLTQDFYQKR